MSLILAVAIGRYGMACAGWGDLVDTFVACTTAGAIVKDLIAVLNINQANYAITEYKVWGR